MASERTDELYKQHTWNRYVDARRLEVSCGERTSCKA